MFWSMNKKGEKTYISNPPTKARIGKYVSFLDYKTKNQGKTNAKIILKHANYEEQRLTLALYANQLLPNCQIESFAAASLVYLESQKKERRGSPFTISIQKFVDTMSLLASSLKLEFINELDLTAETI